jgi:protocadherin Fat 1/2/3
MYFQTKGVLSVTCDLRTLPMRRRELNVTATDGQHFSDVMPVIVRLVNDDDEDGDGESTSRSSKKKHKKMMTSNFAGDSSFECKETDVAKRLTLMLSESERNNAMSEFGDAESEASNMPSRFGTNIHRPEIENLPSVIRINETTPPGTLLVKVRRFLINKSHSKINGWVS